ncbi:hypothetical protein [Streptomyces sp. AM 3-1-1]|uniref:hypothetical protein n=1 Tax=Streptomyces sp. AM 3-1-1 TaxID=3028711 RepID=UPI0023B9EC6D|nr:hypothetical protein [Streptomyces sp. AM 3-1-1]WEH28865.1 hypothetical protein P0D76_16860 [Streptomyces sp. AM 3-1-1]
MTARRTWAIGGALVVVAVGAGLGAAASQGAFSPRGDIAASDVRSTVPDRAKTAEVPRSVLREESSSSFEETLLPRKNDHFTSLWTSRAPGEAVRDLAVSVRASEPLDTGSGNARRVLLTLATDFARQAHMDARCDLPARLPEG